VTIVVSSLKFAVACPELPDIRDREPRGKTGYDILSLGNTTYLLRRPKLSEMIMFII
jgi:hypothetical protein